MDSSIIKQETQTFAQKVSSMEVVSQTTYESAAILKKDIEHFKKTRVIPVFQPSIDAAKKAKASAEEARKVAIATLDRFIKPIEEAETILKRKCRAYEDKCAEEERRMKAEDEARKRKLAEEAEEKAFQGKEEEAKEILKELEEHEEGMELSPPKEIKKQTGLGIRRDWEPVITNESLVPREFLMLDMVKIRKYVREHKQNTDIPGVKAQIKEI